MKTKKAERSDRTSMTFPTNVWRAYSTWCRQNGWYPSHRLGKFMEKELERAGIDWRADSSFADVEVGTVPKTLGVKPESRTEYSWGNYIPSGEAVNTTESPADEVEAVEAVEVVEPEVVETEEDEFAHINKMFKL